MWKLLLLFLFTVVPAVELFLLLQLGSLLGPMQTFLIVLGTGILGAWLAKREGFAVLRQLQADLAKGLPPAVRVVEGALVLVGGLLLVTPGVLSDLTGILLLLPPVRRSIAPRIVARYGG
ncbi:MAG: FxsA family protein, partial [Deltaproteobacteria bacterium]|nr:FxsA family protein [Deltaproteobacteria bacterium]